MGMHTLVPTFEQQQQHHVVPFRVGWVQAGLGSGAMGKLGRAWVGACVHVWMHGRGYFHWLTLF